MKSDTEAIATWERDEPQPEGADHCAAYVCVACAWTGRGGARATAHHTATGHDVRGKLWPASYGNAVFSAPVDPWLADRGER